MKIFNARKNMLHNQRIRLCLMLLTCHNYFMAVDFIYENWKPLVIGASTSICAFGGYAFYKKMCGYEWHSKTHNSVDNNLLDKIQTLETQQKNTLKYIQSIPETNKSLSDSINTLTQTNMSYKTQLNDMSLAINTISTQQKSLSDIVDQQRIERLYPLIEDRTYILSPFIQSIYCECVDVRITEGESPSFIIHANRDFLGRIDTILNHQQLNIIWHGSKNANPNLSETPRPIIILKLPNCLYRFKLLHARAEVTSIKTDFENSLNSVLNVSLDWSQLLYQSNCNASDAKIKMKNPSKCLFKVPLLLKNLILKAQDNQFDKEIDCIIDASNEKQSLQLLNLYNLCSKIISKIPTQQLIVAAKYNSHTHLKQAKNAQITAEENAVVSFQCTKEEMKHFDIKLKDKSCIKCIDDEMRVSM